MCCYPFAVARKIAVLQKDTVNFFHFVPSFLFLNFLFSSRCQHVFNMCLVLCAIDMGGTHKNWKEQTINSRFNIKHFDVYFHNIYMKHICFELAMLLNIATYWSEKVMFELYTICRNAYTNA